MDIVCGGVPSNILIEKFLSNNSTIEGVAAFRNKDKYVLSVYREGTVIPLHEKTLPLYGYTCSMTNRYCCYECKFTFAHRKSDITIGDLWNYKLYPNQHEKGISTLLVHSIKGKNLLNNSPVELHPLTWKDVLYSNKRIVYGKEKIFFPRKRLANNIGRLSYEKFERLYCMKMKPWNVGEYIFKIYRHYVYKFYSAKAKEYIDRIIASQ